MSVLLYVVTHVSHYVVFYTTFRYLLSLCSQGLKLENPISYGHAMSFLMHVVDHVPHYLVFDTMLPFHSLLLARVSEFRFFHPMS